MIYEIGDQNFGPWKTIRGSVANGFYREIV